MLEFILAHVNNNNIENLNNNSNNNSNNNNFDLFEFGVMFGFVSVKDSIEAIKTLIKKNNNNLSFNILTDDVDGQLLVFSKVYTYIHAHTYIITKTKTNVYNLTYTITML